MLATLGESPGAGSLRQIIDLTANLHTGRDMVPPAVGTCLFARENLEFGGEDEMKEESEQSFETKCCPICAELLPVSEFGICRARKDGLNLYCKVCIRRKVTDSRKALREYKSRKRDAQLSVMVPATSESDLISPVEYRSRVINKLSPVERVREAIRQGAGTQKEIAQATKLGKDEIGDALANLLLWTHEIRTEMVNNARLYFINESIILQDGTNRRVPRRKPDVPSSFSALQGLMPGKNPDDEPERIGGWVAA